MFQPKSSVPSRFRWINRCVNLWIKSTRRGLQKAPTGECLTGLHASYPMTRLVSAIRELSSVVRNRGCGSMDPKHADRTDRLTMCSQS